MYKFLAKNGQLIAFGVGTVVTLIFLISVFSGLETFSTLSKENAGQTNIFNFGLYASIGLTILGALAALGFGLFQVATNPKAAIKGIVAIAVIAVVFFIARSFSSDAGIVDTLAKFDIAPAVSTFITGAILTTIALAGLAALAFIVSEVSNFFK